MTMQLGMITIDCANPRELAGFWTKALGTEIAEDYTEFIILAPTPGGSVALGLQRVPEELAGKNRLHLDFHTEDRAAEVARLVDLGAEVVGKHDGPGVKWTVLADPAGNVFCVAATNEG